MDTQDGSKNLLTQPPCEDLQEEDASWSEKKGAIPAELRNDVDKLQKQSDDTSSKEKLTTDESDIWSQTKEHTPKQPTASPTSLSEESNDKKSKKNDQVPVIIYWGTQ